MKYISADGNNTSYSNLDVARMVCALLIVMIHTSAARNTHPLVQFYLEDVIARIAVPLFFAISGFLFFGKLKIENGRIVRCTENHRKLIRYTNRILCLYLSWSLVYLCLVKIPRWYRTGWWGLHAVKDAIAAVAFAGTHYHLWYLLALIYAVPVLFFLLQVISIRKMVGFVALLWLCECLTYSYSWVGVENIAFVSILEGRIPITFDALFRAIPLLTMGAYTALKPGRKEISFFGFATAFALCAMEATLLRQFSPNDSKFSYLLFTPFLAYMGINWLVSVRQCGLSDGTCRAFRHLSEIVYCLHPLVMDFVCSYICVSGFWLWGIVTAASLLLAWGMMQLKQAILIRKK